VGPDIGDERGGGSVVQGRVRVAVAVGAARQQIVLGRLGNHDLRPVAHESGAEVALDEIMEKLPRPNTGLVGHVHIRFVLGGNAHQGDAVGLHGVGVIHQLGGVSGVTSSQQVSAVVQVVVAFHIGGGGPFRGPNLRTTQTHGLFHDREFAVGSIRRDAATEHG
jgi:hypothetical protein